MQFTDQDETWIEWSEDNEDRDDATKLGALHEIIARLARDQVSSGEITADWANKKLAKLGVTERIGTLNTYVLEAHASGLVRLSVTAANRADAMEQFRQRTRGLNTVNITSPAVQDADADLAFASGPEDVDPSAVDPDVPTTVQATLDMLREVILLGNIAGPRFDCDSGANRVLASFGLAPVPARKQFTVGVPVEGIMKTTVTAYDEESAKRVAGWRWNNSQAGFDIDHVTDLGNLAVTAVA